MLLKRWHAGRLSQTYPDVTWNNRICPNGIEKSAAPFGAALAEFIVGAVALVIVEVFPLQIAMLFGAANESAYYADFTVKCFRTYLCLMPLATLNKGTLPACNTAARSFARASATATISPAQIFTRSFSGIGRERWAGATPAAISACGSKNS